jgi:hypothetical protein
MGATPWTTGAKIRIYTERKLNLASIVARHFRSFSIIYGTGFFNGVAEECAIIEIVSAGPIYRHNPEALALAEEIRSKNGQEAVLVTVEGAEVCIALPSGRRPDREED